MLQVEYVKIPSFFRSLNALDINCFWVLTLLVISSSSKLSIVSLVKVPDPEHGASNNILSKVK